MHDERAAYQRRRIMQAQILFLWKPTIRQLFSGFDSGILS